jgi:acylphosphatase
VSIAVRKRAVISGNVQGVFFRATCRRVAEEHGVSGRADNLPNGTVEVVLEGAPEAVDAVLEWCHEGPPLASVSSVEVNEEEPQGLRGFEAR